MATIMGARVLGLDQSTGSLEPGKLADIIVVDLSAPHNWPPFRRSEEAVYSQLVYATKGNDVTDVMCNGAWLMRERALLTIDEELIMADAHKVARKIDAFLIEREKSVLNKLATIGGLSPRETFEVQATAYLSEEEARTIVEMITGPDFVIGKSSLRRQYDTYFLFHDQSASRLRYREDEVLVRDALSEEPLPDGYVSEVIYRLTLANQEKEQVFDNSVVLSHLNFDARANRSLRFYREYFRPDEERKVYKERRRFHVRYGATGFTINIDRVQQPAFPGVFVGISSRTWSAQDAERKAELIGEILAQFDIGPDKLMRETYLELAAHPETIRPVK